MMVWRMYLLSNMAILGIILTISGGCPAKIRNLSLSMPSIRLEILVDELYLNMAILVQNFGKKTTKTRWNWRGPGTFVGGKREEFLIEEFMIEFWVLLIYVGGWNLIHTWKKTIVLSSM